MPNFDIISEHVGTIAAPFQRNASSEPVPSVEATPLNYNFNFRNMTHLANSLFVYRAPLSLTQAPWPLQSNRGTPS